MRNKAKVKKMFMIGFGVVAIGFGIFSLGEEMEKSNILEEYKTRGLESVNGTQFDEKCSVYELQKDGSYECGDERNGIRDNPILYFFNGKSYSAYSTMEHSNDYRENNLLNGTNHRSVSVKEGDDKQ